VGKGSKVREMPALLYRVSPSYQPWWYKRKNVKKDNKLDLTNKGME
jgi:hypothetical protein